MFRSIASRTGPKSLHLRVSQTYPRRHLTQPYTGYHGPIDPSIYDESKRFDITLPEINPEMLAGDVSDRLGYPYLSHAPNTDKPAGKICGMIPRYRAFFTLPVSLNCRSFHVHFIYISTSPFTYFSPVVCESFFGAGDNVPEVFDARLGGRPMVVHQAPGSCSFRGANILGANFCALYNTRMLLDFEKGEAKITFPDRMT